MGDQLIALAWARAELDTTPAWLAFSAPSRGEADALWSEVAPYHKVFEDGL